MANKNVEARLKVWLLEGKRITSNQALRMFGTNRLAEFIRRLRKEHGMKITTELVSEDGDVYGVYYLDPLFLRRKKRNLSFNPCSAGCILRSGPAKHRCH